MLVAQLPPLSPPQDSVPDRLEPEAGGSFLWNNGKLLIPAVEEAHAGLYTCQLNVLINNQRFKVSRAILLRVEGGRRLHVVWDSPPNAGGRRPLADKPAHYT